MLAAQDSQVQATDGALHGYAHQLHPCRPFVVIIGGAKVVDKLGVLTELVQVADKVIVGGRMAFTFLAQQGVALGRTHVDHEVAQQAASILELAAANVCSPPLTAPHLILSQTTHACARHYLLLTTQSSSLTACSAGLVLE